MTSTKTDMAAKLAEIGPLQNGGHNDPGADACIMEAVSYVAGEPWSDHPACASAAGAAARDALADTRRQLQQSACFLLDRMIDCGSPQQERAA